MNCPNCGKPMYLDMTERVWVCFHPPSTAYYVRRDGSDHKREQEKENERNIDR